MKNISEKTNPPDLRIHAELFIATGCAHCPIVMAELNNLVKSGKLAQLKTINIAVDNDRASKMNIRSVPWFSLSNEACSMVFTGSYNAKEIDKWVTVASNNNPMQEYIETFLANGELQTVVHTIQLFPEMLIHVINMLNDEETSMDIRIGLDVLIEQFSASKTLQQYSEQIKKMAEEPNPRLQIDALHYLALTGDKNNKKFIEEKTQDKDLQIKEAAIEALETLDDLLS